MAYQFAARLLAICAFISFTFAQQAIYQQCGGIGWCVKFMCIGVERLIGQSRTGGTTCVSGCTCQELNTCAPILWLHLLRKFEGHLPQITINAYLELPHPHLCLRLLHRAQVAALHRPPVPRLLRVKPVLQMFLQNGSLLTPRHCRRRMSSHDVED